MGLEVQFPVVFKINRQKIKKENDRLVIKTSNSDYCKKSVLYFMHIAMAADCQSLKRKSVLATFEEIMAECLKAKVIIIKQIL